ncbi:MAG: cation-translocating P-type ATPase [Gemmataceae bacterium]|nr:cation-translocating P-type ATPase [Gemmataceae bacterium]
MRSLHEIQVHFPSHRENGLEEGEVFRSRERYGPNQLTPLPTPSPWTSFLEKFDEPIIKILLFAAVLSFFIELFQAQSKNYAWVGIGLLAGILGPNLLVPVFRKLAPAFLAFFALPLFFLGLASGHPSFEGLAVMAAVILATGVAFLSEWKSSREFQKLNANKDSIQVKTIRSGKFHKLKLEDLVVGDLVLLETGDEVPADGRVIQGHELSIDQSLLTGESEPAEKNIQGEAQSPGAENPSCLYRGTQVISGMGRMTICATGDATEIGQIALRLGHPELQGNAGGMESRILKKMAMRQETTPLQEKLAVLAAWISKVGYAAASLILLSLFIRGAFFTSPREVFFPATLDEFFLVASNCVDYFLYMIIIIVVAVPEGLPMSVTISLAMAMRKMTRNKSLVRQLMACETIGSATVICTDKTGTMTENRMAVQGWISPCVPDIQPGEIPPEAGLCQGKVPQNPLAWIAFNSAVNSTAHLEEKDGKVIPAGNSTEASLLLWLRKSGIDYRVFRASHPHTRLSQFSSEKKIMDSTVKVEEHFARLVKGAPEQLLALCAGVNQGDNSFTPLSGELRQELGNRMAVQAGQAMRILGFAHETLLPENSGGESNSRLILDGFVLIRDPLRKEVPASIQECQIAGIKVIMITGDNLVTAQAIARDAGLAVQGDKGCLPGEELRTLTDPDLQVRLQQVSVIARATPMDKFRVVRLLQDSGHVVAATGDGTNDAPALKKADVGLSMGIAGTEVAKEASKIVLLDDSFATIVRAVHWGRALYENIQRFLVFQLTINLSALLIAFLGPFLGVRPPFTILQLLWINVIMDSFAAIALCSEPPRPGLMKAAPKKRNENIITPSMKAGILATAGFFVAVMILLLLGMKNLGWFAGADPAPPGWEFSPLTPRQVSLFFSVYVLFQLWNLINCRSISPLQSGLQGILKNPPFIAIMLAILAGQLAIVQWGGAIFRVVPLAVVDWLVILAATSVILAFSELSKWGQRKFFKLS